MTDNDAVKGWPGLRAARPLNVATDSLSAGVREAGELPRFFGERNWLWGLLLVMVILAYQPTWHAGFIWDDELHVTQNPTLRDWTGLKDIWFDIGKTFQYYPLVHSSFWLEYHFWELNPLGYHLVNVMLHALAAILLYCLLLRLRLAGAWLVAAIFALHPVCVESVAWVSERKNVLSTVLYLAAALAYLRFAPLEGGVPGVGSADGDKGSGRCRNGRWYLAALFLFVAALLSKTVACSLPAALLLGIWWKQGKITRRDLGPLLPFFAAGLVLGLNTVWLEKHQVGAKGAEWLMTFGERFLIAGRAFWFYAAKLVWPANLTFIYPLWKISTAVWWQWCFPMFALLFVGALWFLRHRIGRGPLVAVLFFAGTLFPALGFFYVYPFRYSFVADHFQYLASLGLLALAGVGIHSACRRLGKTAPLLGQTLIGTLLVVLGLLTWRQCEMYADLKTLWQATIERNPKSDLAHNNLGNILFKEGRVDQAITHYLKALAIQPDYPEGHYNLGMALVKQGRVDEAIPHFEKAAQPGPGSQKVRAVARNNLGDLLLQRGREDEAIAYYQAAMQMDPGLASARSGLGNVLLRRDRVAEAIANYEAAIRIQPDNPLTVNNLAWVLATCSDASLRNGAKAVELAERACEITGHRQTIFIGTLAAAYAEAGWFEKAAETAQKASALASSLGQTDLVKRNQELLEQFKKGKPWREPD